MFLQLNLTKNLLLKIYIILAMGFLIILPACLPLSVSPTPLPTDTLSPPPSTPTETPVWFPPTATNTPYPAVSVVITPTLDLAVPYGELIFSDDFSNPETWTLNRGSSESAAIANNELTLALSKSGDYVYSVRVEPELRDFRLEITVNPSICRGGDEYGLLLRFVDPDNFYRFALTCDGQARVDRVYKGHPSSPQPLSLFGSIPPGAPSSSRLVVSANGREMRFFINGEFLFSISDPTLPIGLIGVFIHSNEENAVTVNFADLEVYKSIE